MTQPPSFAAWLKRPVPELSRQVYEEFDALWCSVKKATAVMPAPWVLAEAFDDPDDDAVFGAAFAVQLVDKEPWLVRGVLRSVPPGPPVMSRITVDHLTDRAREATGKVVRDINFGTIRDAALMRLRQRGHNRTLLHASDPDLFTKKQVAEAEATAIRAARGARGPRGAYTAEHYRRIALRYLELVADGRRDVVNALCEEEAERLGEPVARERMRDWIRKTVRMGFLAPGKSGVVGREPGPNLNTKEDQSG
jgi:hypothetical protein